MSGELPSVVVSEARLRQYRRTIGDGRPRAGVDTRDAKHWITDIGCGILLKATYVGKGKVTWQVALIRRSVEKSGYALPD